MISALEEASCHEYLAEASLAEAEERVVYRA